MPKQRYFKDQMQQMLVRYEKSELSHGAFCAQEKINPHTFDYWRKKLTKSKRSKRQKKEADFISVVPELNSFSPSSLIYIRLSTGHTIELPADYPPVDLTKLIRTLSC